MTDWRVHPALEEAAPLASQLQIHPLVVSILMRRGLRSAADMTRFLAPALSDLQDPFAFSDMRIAVERIQKAIADKAKILVYGDYDVDGVTASAILWPVLRDMGADVEIHLPHRIKEGYGLNRNSLERWVERGVSLVITVDNGITSLDAVRFLKEKGLGVILVDHHVPKDEVPPADAILSGALPGRGGDPSLAACGLAFKLVWALLGDFEKAKPYLDLVTLGTIADLAPVEGENRVLLKWGLPILSRSRRPGIRALMNVARIHPDHVSYRDIAFGLGPRINAAGRMGSAMNAFKLLTTENDLEARNLAQILEAGNKERQHAEAEAFRQAAQFVEEKISKEERHILIVESGDWHEGVLGIVAARLVERFQRPAIVIAMREDGTGKGSGRSLPYFSIFDHVYQCEDLLEAFGGHAQACGLTIRSEKLNEFRRRLNALAAHTLASADESAGVWLEGELRPAQLEATLVRDLEKLAPFGPGNARPLFISRAMHVRGDVKKRGKDTLQCWMSDSEEKVTCEVVGFRSFERWQAQAQKKREFDIVYQPTLRSFNGITSITLELESWR